MHLQVDARRWARLLGAAVLGGVLAVGVTAALPAEAATTASSTPRLSFDIDLNNLSEEGSYGDGSTDQSTSDDANGLSDSDEANGLSSGDEANGLANGLSSGDMANGLTANGLTANGLSSSQANGL